MTKSLDSILDAITNVDDAVAYIKTEKIVASDEKGRDLDKILLILDKASSTLIEAVPIYQKYETKQ